MHVLVVVVDVLYLHTCIHVRNLVSCVFVPSTISRPLYILGKSLSLDTSGWAFIMVVQGLVVISMGINSKAR